jgi:hypothetical protein
VPTGGIFLTSEVSRGNYDLNAALSGIISFFVFAKALIDFSG